MTTCKCGARIVPGEVHCVTCMTLAQVANGYIKPTALVS